MRRKVHAFGSSTLTSDAHLPAPDLNTTPLIDIMLVLLIMFIVTIPVSTHKVPLELPQPGPTAVRGDPVVHRLDLSAAGTLAWDGAAVSDADLAARLQALKAEPDAELHMRTDGAAP